MEVKYGVSGVFVSNEVKQDAQMAQSSQPYQEVLGISLRPRQVGGFCWLTIFT